MAIFCDVKKNNKTSQRAEVFLCCNQCIETLNLGSQANLLKDFHFYPYNGGFHFFRHQLEGIKQCFSEKEKCRVVCYVKRHLKPPGPNKSFDSMVLNVKNTKIFPFINSKKHGYHKLVLKQMKLLKCTFESHY